VHDLDSSGARYSQDLSEVDLSDLENLKVRVNDPAGDVLVELGSAEYLKRYQIYVTHVRDWRQQFQKLESVNLRYDNQVIVNPDVEGKPKQAALTPSAAKAAAAAGVKTAALISHIGPHERPLPKPAFELTEKKLEPKTTPKKPAAKVKAKTFGPKPAPKKVAAKHPAASGKKTAHATSAKAGAKKPAHAAAVANAGTPKPSAAVSRQQ
jgi:cell division protein FtsQ